MMQGRTHATTGALALTAAVAIPALGFHPAPGAELLDAVLFAGAALLPDLDCPHSTVAVEFGFLTKGFARVVAFLACGHREATHSEVGVAVFTAAGVYLAVLAALIPGHVGRFPVAGFAPRVVTGLYLALIIGAALRALRIGGHAHDTLGLGAAAAMVVTGYGLGMMPWALFFGCNVHILGDMVTRHGCPVLWPLSRHEFHLLGPVRITTGHVVERVFFVAATVATLYLLGTQTGAAHLLIAHT